MMGWSDSLRVWDWVCIAALVAVACTTGDRLLMAAALAIPGLGLIADHVKRLDVLWLSLALFGVNVCIYIACLFRLVASTA